MKIKYSHTLDTASKSSVWAFIRRYWNSSQSRTGWGLLIIVISLDMCMVYRASSLTYWQKDFFDALSTRKLEIFWHLLARLGLLGLVAVLIDIVRTYCVQYLEMNWRRWLTTDLLQRCLESPAWSNPDETIPNHPDQRISEDIRLLTTSVLSLGLGLFSNFITFFTFSNMLYELSGSLNLSFNDHDYVIYGFMLWVAILFATLSSFIMEWCGRRLVTADKSQQSYEADFRAELINTYRYRQEIILLGGQLSTCRNLLELFNTIYNNWREIMRCTTRVTALDRLYTEAGALIPYALAGPRYFANHLSLGDLMQLTQSFLRVRAALSWFIYRYKEISILRAACQRLIQLESSLTANVNTGVLLKRTAGSELNFQATSLSLPCGRPILTNADFNIRNGERWLITGKSGSGKSTLLRCLLQGWPYGQGKVVRPLEWKVLCLSQRAYLPPGNIQAILAYPQEASYWPQSRYVEVLQMVGLIHLLNETVACKKIEDILSPGEVQRIGFARIILHQPDFVCLDEATSSLDENSEEFLYQLMIKEIPDATIISIAHRAGLKKYHTHHAILDNANLNLRYRYLNA